MHDVATVVASARLPERPEPPSGQLLDDGLRLVVEGLASSLSGAAVGIFATASAGEPQLVALASSVEDDDAGSVLTAAAVARARDNALAGPTTEVRRHSTHLVLRDRVGRPRGLLFVAVDEGASALTAVSAYALITAYAAQAESEIRGSVEQQVLDERVRLAETARQVVRYASSPLEPTTAAAAIEETLREGFRADLVRLRTSSDEAFALRDPSQPPLPPRVVAIARATSRRLWATQRVSVLEQGSRPDGVLTPGEHASMLELLGQMGLASVLMVPLGFRSTCHGYLAFGRADPATPWSEQEARVALEIGGDLGRAVHNLEAMIRERDLARQMRALDSARSALIADVSHELRDPLTTLVGHLELLEVADDATGEVGRSLHAMERSAERLRRIVEDLTMLGRVGDPSSPLESAVVDVGAVAREVVDLVSVTAEKAGVALELTVAADDATTQGSAVELDRALGNLVSNAVKYGRRGGRVEVAVRRTGGEVVVSCRDDGLGIAEEDLPLLFTEFFRSTNSEALHRPGTGLGLAIVQRIARRHRGRVEVTSRLGEGSEFRLYLPAGPTSAG